jgi:hypothetical protein
MIISDINMTNHQLLHTPPRQAAIDANARLNVMLTPAAAAVTPHNNNVCSDDSDASSSLIEPEDAECSICLESPSVEDFSTIRGCDHMFCLQCITTWSERNNVCPFCRVRFTYIQSTGGVLYQVPDRRPTAFTALFNLRARFVSNAVRTLIALFNFEVEGGMNHPLDIVRAALDRWQPHQIRAELAVVCWLSRLLLSDFTTEHLLVELNQILEVSIAELRRPSMTATCWPAVRLAMNFASLFSLDQNPDINMRALLRRLRVRGHIYPPETYSQTGLHRWESIFSMYLERVLAQTRERRVVYFCPEVEIFCLDQSDNETRSMLPCYSLLRLYNYRLPVRWEEGWPLP